MPNPIKSSVGDSERVTAHGHRSNGFDLIRIVAAVMVLVGHTFELSHHTVPGFLDNSISTIGVKIFFITSGFLVTKSWFADPSPIRFALRRLLRIIPGLTGVILVTLLVLGPLLTVLPLRVYFGDQWTWYYLWNLAFYPIYSLPGLFADNPYPFAVNGSLWSLPVEVFMYALLPFVIGQGRMRARFTLPIITCAACIAAIYCVRMSPGSVVRVIYGTGMSPLLEVSCYFAIGSVWALFGWQRFARPWIAIGILVMASWFVPGLLPPALSSPLSELALMIALPFAVIACGVQRFAWYDRPASLGDVSYGLYLYAFPVQQSVLALSHGQLGVFAVIAITLPVTAFLAVLSWICVERSALALKPTRHRAVERRPAFGETSLAAVDGVELQAPRG